MKGFLFLAKLTLILKINPLHNFKYFNFLNSATLLLGIFLLVVGCQTENNENQKNTYSLQEAELNELKIRFSELEESIQGKKSQADLENIKVNVSPIKSLTFRLGSNDDRLRIYWKDGSKTDLPCTKEQSIWACG